MLRQSCDNCVIWLRHLPVTLMIYTPIKQRELQVIEDEVIHLQLLVDDLFTLARADVGKLELRYESTDVGQLVRGIVENSAPIVWQSSRIEVVAGTPPEIVYVLVDPKQSSSWSRIQAKEFRPRICLTYGSDSIKRRDLELAQIVVQVWAWR
jgi:signal transduction histidine kinase